MECSPPSHDVAEALPCRSGDASLVAVVTVEICVADEAGAVAAIAGGADRIELCAALEAGGLTPSLALLGRVLARARPAGVEVHAMVRPRAGDFVYDADELALAIAEGQALVGAGADGLVFGACRGAWLDEAALADFADAHAGTRLTLHRAIDLVADPVAAVGTAIALRYERILSSGGAATADQGADTLRRMVERAAGRCRIAAGSGVRADNVAGLIARTGVDHVHGSASLPRPAVDARVVALGFAVGPRRMTDREAVAALCAAASKPV